MAEAQVNVANTDGLATEDKQDDIISEVQKLVGFEIPPYDEISLGYTVDDLTTVIYKLASVAVATLTLSYTSGNITNVIKS
jgi:hypothetical protein